jgi:hypothetical protein
MKMKTFEWITSKIHSKLGGYTQWVHLWCTQQQYKKSSHATNPQVGPRTFESIVSKSTQRLGLVGDRYPPGPLEGENPCVGTQTSRPTRSSHRGPGKDYN